MRQVNNSDFRFGNLDSLFYLNDQVEAKERKVEMLLKKYKK